MLGMLKRHEIEILLKAGHSKAEAARLAGISLRSVKRIAAEAPVVHVDDAAEREKRRIGRPSIVEDFREPVLKILEEKPDLPSLEILRRVREAGYQGGKTALYALVATVRPKEIKPLIRFEGLPGEFSQHDFGEVDVTFLDGAIHRIHFFASRLKYSRFICVRVELCWPHSPQQKGAVENLVGFVKSSFFKVRRFHDQEDLAQQLIEWHREVNQERACRATGIIPAVRLAEEASRLRSLKVHPKDLALRIPVYVGPTGTVLHDGHPYSMPPEAISMPATLYLYADHVRIVAGRYEVNHPRKFVAHEGSTLAAHRAAMVAAVSGKRGKRYLKRQQLLELGEPAFLYLTEIVHRRPGQWFHDVDRLHDILQNHGAEVLRRAMEQGLQEQVFGATYIDRFLQRSLVFQEVIS